MNKDQLFNLFRNAGFNVEALGNNVLVSLDNRHVDTMEVSMVLGERRNKITRVANKVMITPMTITIR